MPEFNYLTTHVGSAPHTGAHDLNKRLLSMLDIPCWLQLPRRDFRENIYTQYAPTLPGTVVLEEKEKAVIDFNSPDFDAQLERFYHSVLDDDVDAFALHPEYAQGFYALTESLKDHPCPCAKEAYVDVLVKHMTFNARWQIEQLKKVSDKVILFVDEPYMASFGSAYVSLGKEQVIAWLDEVYNALRTAGAITGTHCCGNTDWGVLLNTKVDILNLDAYDFIENLALYPVELREFLDRGGAICWGLIPNTEQIFNETPQLLTKKLRNGIKLIVQKAARRGITIHPEEFASRSLIAPACGLGSASVEIADRVFDVLAETAALLKQG
jgi:hypothetical protein